MPLSHQDFASIRTAVEAIVREVIGGRADYFISGDVVKRDVEKKLVWIEELGSQAIPVVAFDYTVRYYDMQPTGSAGAYAGSQTVAKTATAQVVIPKVGDNILVVCERGNRRLPRCLGKIQGRDWFTVED
jgi:hypothetical protein